MPSPSASIVALKSLRPLGRKRVPLETAEARIIELCAFLRPPVPGKYENRDEAITGDDIQHQIRQQKDKFRTLKIMRQYNHDAQIKIVLKMNKYYYKSLYIVMINNFLYYNVQL
jgi:aspartyl/asparaginyl beta-hydroxylase (cupin superfamily)